MTFDEWWEKDGAKITESRKVCARLAWRAACRKHVRKLHRYTILTADDKDLSGAVLAGCSAHDVAEALSWGYPRRLRMVVREHGNGKGERVYVWEPSDESLTLEDQPEVVM